MSAVSTVQIIRVIFPEMRGTELQKAIQQFDAVTNANKGTNKEKSQDYRRGYNIGMWLYAQGEELGGFKELDTTAQELLGLDHSVLPVNDPTSFTEYSPAEERFGMRRSQHASRLVRTASSWAANSESYFCGAVLRG